MSLVSRVRMKWRQYSSTTTLNIEQLSCAPRSLGRTSCAWRHFAKTWTHSRCDLLRVAARRPCAPCAGGSSTSTRLSARSNPGCLVYWRMGSMATATQFWRAAQVAKRARVVCDRCDNLSGVTVTDFGTTDIFVGDGATSHIVLFLAGGGMRPLASLVIHPLASAFLHPPSSGHSPDILSPRSKLDVDDGHLIHVTFNGPT